MDGESGGISEKAPLELKNGYCGSVVIPARRTEKKTLHAESKTIQNSTGPNARMATG